MPFTATFLLLRWMNWRIRSNAMLKENIGMLRNINGFSQEYVAERIGISRQAYSKWEKGRQYLKGIT